MNTLVGAKIKSLRKQKGLTQEVVADYLHISQPTYARIENGETNSWVNYLKPISELFEINPEELIKQDNIVICNNQQGGESTNGYVINQLSEKLIEQYEKRIEEKDKIISSLKEQIKDLSK